VILLSVCCGNSSRRNAESYDDGPAKCTTFGGTLHGRREGPLTGRLRNQLSDPELPAAKVKWDGTLLTSRDGSDIHDL